MKLRIHRRQFLQSALLAASGLSLARPLNQAASATAFSFVLLGDLHYDKLEHHDLAWLEKEKPDDLRQVRDYSRITAEILPKLFATVRETIADLNRAAQAPVAFVAQTGDLVEGLCGSEPLATRQDEEAIALVRGAKLSVPFLFTKGNHDVTGPGAADAFQKVFQPYLAEQAVALGGGGKLAGACYSLEHGNALFCFFDAYGKESLAWLEGALARSTAQHCFVAMHPPVVPCGARSLWYLYSNERQKAQRERLLNLLGRRSAIVLSAHVHKYSLLVRQTPQRGRFLQLATNSVISTLDVKAKRELSGVKEYTGDQVKLEPNFSPATEKERRAVYDAESPFVTQFEYADLPGYAVVTVNGANVEARVFPGAARSVWRTLNLSSLLRS